MKTIRNQIKYHIGLQFTMFYLKLSVFDFNADTKRTINRQQTKKIS